MSGAGNPGDVQPPGAARSRAAGPQVRRPACTDPRRSTASMAGSFAAPSLASFSLAISKNWIAPGFARRERRRLNPLLAVIEIARRGRHFDFDRASKPRRYAERGKDGDRPDQGLDGVMPEQPDHGECG